MTVSPQKKSSTPNLANNLVEILDFRAEFHGVENKLNFLESGDFAGEISQLSYKLLRHDALKIADALLAKQAATERALLFFPAGLDFLKAFFGCVYAQVVAVPTVSPNLGNKMDRLLQNLVGIIKDCDARYVITTEKIIANHRDVIEKIPELRHLQWLTVPELLNHSHTENKQARLPEITNNHLAFLQYTSGSTAHPKGVMVSHGNIVNNLETIRAGFKLSAKDISVNWLPHYHDMGLVGNLLTAIYCGITQYQMSPAAFFQRPRRWLEAISYFKASVSGGPNFAYALCCEKIKHEVMAELDLSSWEVAFSGGEPVHHHTLLKFSEYFSACRFSASAFLPCYGLAESTLYVSGKERESHYQVFYCDPNKLSQNQLFEACETSVLVDAQNTAENTRSDNQQEPAQKPLVSAGLPSQNGQVVIVNPQTETPCRPGEIGEIWIAGPSVAQGYWAGHDPHVFNNTLSEHDELFKTPTHTGFMRSGDLGCLIKGQLYVTGRLKDVLILNGHNYYPQDFESAIENLSDFIRVGGVAAFLKKTNNTQAAEADNKEKLAIVAELTRKKSMLTCRL